MIRHCKIKKCRFPTHHTSIGHLCGSCNNFGHGIIECNNNYLQLDNYTDIIPLENQCMFSGCKNKQYHTTQGHHCYQCLDRLHSAETCPTIIVDIKLDCPICRTENIIKSNQNIIKGLTDQCSICLENIVEIYFPKCGHVCICNKCINKLNKNKFDSIRDESILTAELYDISLIKSHLLDYPSYLIIQEGNGCITYIRRLNLNSQIEGLFYHSDDKNSIQKVNKIKDFLQGYCGILLITPINHN